MAEIAAGEIAKKASDTPAHRDATCQCGAAAANATPPVTAPPAKKD